MKDPVLQDEERYDRECQIADKARQAAVEELQEKILEDVAFGAYDTDLSSYFDASVLMRIARIYALKDPELALSLTWGDLVDIKNGMEEWALDMAERRVE